MQRIRAEQIVRRYPPVKHANVHLWISGVSAASSVALPCVKSMDWAGHKAKFHSKADPGLINKARQYIAVLLALL